MRINSFVLFLFILLSSLCQSYELIDGGINATAIALGGNWLYPENRDVTISPGAKTASVALDNQEILGDYVGRMRVTYPLSSFMVAGYSFAYRQIGIEKWDDNNVKTGNENFSAIQNTVSAGFNVMETENWKSYMAIEFDYFSQTSVASAGLMSLSYAFTRENTGVGISIEDISSLGIPVTVSLNSRLKYTYAGCGMQNDFFYLSIGQRIPLPYKELSINIGGKYLPKAEHVDFGFGVSLKPVDALQLSFGINFGPVTDILNLSTDYDFGIRAPEKQEEQGLW